MALLSDSLVAADQLLCGVGQPGHVCDQPAVGALAVHVQPGKFGAVRLPRQPAVVLLCVGHLAAFNEPAAAAFPPDDLDTPGSGPGPHPPATTAFPPGAGTKGA